MARKFTDRSGQTWTVEREHGRHELIFRPVHGKQSEERTAPLPSHRHTQDPYELSQAELQRMLDGSKPRYRKPSDPPPF